MQNKMTESVDKLMDSFTKLERLLRKEISDLEIENRELKRVLRKYEL